MNEPRKPSPNPTVEQLATEVAQLRDRVEDLEDARELDEAISRNANKPLIPWDRAKKDLDLE